MKLLLSLSLVVFLAGCNLFQDSSTEVEMESQVQTSPPEDVIDQESGEVDDEAFEENQRVSEDDSLLTIEQELESTVILEEDFSDFE